MDKKIDKKYSDLFDSIYSEQSTLTDKALIGVSRKHCYHKTLREKVGYNLSDIFNENTKIKDAWWALEAFKEENLNQNIRYKDAVTLVSKFIKDNNLE